MQKIGTEQIRQGIQGLNLSGKPVCVHSSLRSFGVIEGGPESILNIFLEEGCTVMVPSFSYMYQADPPGGNPYLQNAWADKPPAPVPADGMFGYDPAQNEISRDMGAIPAELLRREGRIRGKHPLCSFTATGPQADRIIRGQVPLDIFAPFREIAALSGEVLLMGVGLDTMTLIHYAEQLAGRRPFRRWAWSGDRQLTETEVGGCSSGFLDLEAATSGMARRIVVGSSHWTAYPVAPLLELTVATIKKSPDITRCSSSCSRCNDAIAGGPVLPV